MEVLAATVGCRVVIDVRPSRRVVDMRLTRDAEKEILPIIISCRVLEVDDGTEVGLPHWMWMVVVVEEKRGIWYLLVVDISIFLYPKSFSFFAFILILDPKGFRIFGSKRFSYLLKLAGVCGRAKWELDGRVHS